MFSSNTHSKVIIITIQSCMYIITSTVHNTHQYCLGRPGWWGGGGGIFHKPTYKCTLPTATFIQPLVNTTVCLGSTAQFVCSATDVIVILYLVDSMAASSVTSRGVRFSGSAYNGNMTIGNLTIMGTPVNNNSLITCQAAGKDGTTFNSSSYLSIQGQSIYYIPLLPFIPTHQVLHLLPLILPLLHTMVLPPNWPGDHPLMPSPHPFSPMLW